MPIETDDGIKGTLVDAYGPYADPKVISFMEEVERLHKKFPKDGRCKKLSKQCACPSGINRSFCPVWTSQKYFLSTIT
jgi:hypothetical protein